MRLSGSAFSALLLLVMVEIIVLRTFGKKVLVEHGVLHWFGTKFWFWFKATIRAAVYL